MANAGFYRSEETRKRRRRTGNLATYSRILLLYGATASSHKMSEVTDVVLLERVKNQEKSFSVGGEADT